MGAYYNNFFVEKTMKNTCSHNKVIKLALGGIQPYLG